MDKNVKALKSGIWYVLSNLIVRGMTLITTPIFSRLLTHEQYGDYSNFLSWANIAVIIVSMRIESSLISAKFDYGDNLAKYNRSILMLTVLMVASWAIIVNIMPMKFNDLIGLSKMYTNLMLIYCLFQAVINIFQINERYAYKYKQSVSIAILVAISTTVTSILLVVELEDKLEGRVLGGVLPVAVIGIVLFVYFFRESWQIDTSVWKYVLKLCILYVPHLLSLQVLNSIDRIMITNICGPADNALYTIAYTCGHMVTLLMTSMNSAFAPWLGDKLNDGGTEEIRKVTRYYILIFAIVAMAMMLFSPEILFIMGGESYLEAKYVMPPVAMGCVCQFLYSLYVNIEQFRKKTTGMAIVSVLAALFNCGLNAYYIPRYGYIAAAYTTLASYIFLLFAHMLLVKRIEKKAIDNRFVITVMVCMCFVMMLINFLYKNQIFRYTMIFTVLLAIGVVVYIKRDMTKDLLKKIIK